MLISHIHRSGVCLGYIGGKWLNWRNLAFLGDLLLIPYMLLISIVPETPHWYVEIAFCFIEHKNKNQFSIV